MLGMMATVNQTLDRETVELLAEEAGFAYKDIDEVVNALKISGIGHPIVRVKPLGNVKG